MRTSHAILLRLCHDPQYEFGKASVEYVNRGAPDDRSTIQGDEILKLEQGGMEIKSEMGSTYIPYHRIRKISYNGGTMWTHA
ncbi:MAG: DUF504 domain-containing protein [Methanotrichaceae archaeon]